VPLRGFGDQAAANHGAELVEDKGFHGILAASHDWLSRRFPVATKIDWNVISDRNGAETTLRNPQKIVAVRFEIKPHRYR
jgi:hypothetical protein